MKEGQGGMDEAEWVGEEEEVQWEELVVQEELRLRIARRVLGRLLDPIRVDGSIRWDLASPYLLRHAAEHAAECGLLRGLFKDWEFLVHAEPHSVLGFGALLEAESPIRALPVYRASLVKHVSAGPEARRHILAVDATRHQWPDISQRLYHPRHAAPAPWQCRWSTASNISFALRDAFAHPSTVSAVATGTADGRSFAVTTLLDDPVARVWDLNTGSRYREVSVHAGPLTAVAAGGPSHSVVVTAAGDGSLRCWHPYNGQTRWEIAAHNGGVSELQLHEMDGVPVAVTYSNDGTVGIWDLDTGTAHQVFDGVPPLGRMAVTGAGAHVVVAVVGQGYLVCLDPRTGAERFRAQVGDSQISAVAAAHMGGRPVVVITSADGMGQVWDGIGGKLLTTLTCSRDSMATLAVVDTGLECMAVTGGVDGTIRLWDLEHGGRPLRQLTGHIGEITALAWYYTPTARAANPQHPSQRLGSEVSASPTAPRPRLRRSTERDRRARWLASLSGYVLLSASADHTLHEWNLADGSLWQTFTAHTDTPRTISVTEISGRPVAVSSGSDNTVRVWALDDRRAQIAGSVTHPLPVNSLSAARMNGRILVATGCGDERLRVLTASDGRSEGIHLNGTGKVTAVGLGPTREGLVAVVATDDGRLTARRPETGERQWQCTPSDTALSALAVGGSRRHPVALSIDSTGRGRLHVHSLTSGQPHQCDLNGQAGVSAVAAGRIRDKPVSVTGHHDGAVRLWNLTPGTLRRNISGSTAGVSSVALGTTPIGPLVAAACDDGRTRVWDAETGRPWCLISSGHASATAVGESHGRAVVAVVPSRSNTICLWDAETGESHAVLSLPETVGAISMAYGVLVVGYGRELAVFSASDNPGPWDDVLVSRVTQRQPEETKKERHGWRGGRLLPGELAVLAYMGQQSAPLGLPEVRTAFCERFNRQDLKAILRSLLQKGLTQPADDQGRYEPTAQGRNRVERAARRKGLPKRYCVMGGWCAYCSFH